MNYSFYIKSPDEISLIEQLKDTEVILSPKELSRFGVSSLEEVKIMAKLCRERKIKVVLEWDILMEGLAFEAALKVLNTLDLSDFDAIRVQDQGALNYILENFPDLKIQLNLESGNHNLIGIKTWASLIGAQLDKLILSHELSKDKITSYLSALSPRHFKIEVLGLGRILLFYSPRKLLSPPIENKKEESLSAIGKSEESPHKGFKILENTHGTFMFHEKDFYLLNKLDELTEMGLDTLRIDLRFNQSREFLFKTILTYLKSPTDDELKNLLNYYKNPVMQAFYRTNKSTVIFKNLKNQNIKRIDESFVGSVVGVLKNRYTAIVLKNKDLKLSVKDSIEFRTPDGKVKAFNVDKILNSNNQEIPNASFGDLIFVKHSSGISVKSSVYLL